MYFHLLSDVRHLRAGRLFVFSLLFLCCLACDRSPKPISLYGEAQGTYYSITYYDAQQRDMRGAVDSLLAAFDSVASLWCEGSLICRVNDSDSCAVTPLFADLFYKSQSICRYTDGAFDCRIGALVRAYGFAKSQRMELTDAQRDSLLRLCRGEVWMDTAADGTLWIHKEYAGTAIDFNAIAQGYSVDMVASMLDGRGIHDYLVDIGGEVIGRGSKPDGSPWTVGIERPAADKDAARQVETAITLRDLSVVTSGSYRKYYEVDGARYSHTIDPATGSPVAHTTLSASVIDSAAWRADALATAFMVMGRERGAQWLQRHPEVKAVYMMYDSASSLCHFSTPQFEECIKK